MDIYLFTDLDVFLNAFNDMNTMDFDSTTNKFYNLQLEKEYGKSKSDPNDNSEMEFEQSVIDDILSS